MWSVNLFSSFFTFLSHHSLSCHQESATLANFGPHVGRPAWRWWWWLFAFWICLSAKYSAQLKLGHSKNFGMSKSSVSFWRVLDFTGMRGTPCPSALWRFSRALVASLNPGRCHKGPACLFESRLLTWITLFYRAFCHEGASWLTSKCTMKSKYLTHSSVRLCASWDARQTSSICHRSHIEVNFMSPFVALLNASLALWWWLPEISTAFISFGKNWCSTMIRSFPCFSDSVHRTFIGSYKNFHTYLWSYPQIRNASMNGHWIVFEVFFN